MANNCKTSPRRIEARERAARALELRKQGYTFEQIAVELGYRGRQGAFESVMAALREVTREAAEELIQLDLERLDALWVPQYQAALGGDAQALAGCLRIMERRARLLGLDMSPKEAQEPAAPTKVMLVPVFQNADDWERAAVQSQAQLKRDVRE